MQNQLLDNMFKIQRLNNLNSNIKDALNEAGLKPNHSQVTMEPATRVELNLGDAEKFMKLIDRLEDLDDVQEVYHNADISEEIMAQL